METPEKEVDFYRYCKECKHKKVKTSEEPCNECLHSPSNYRSRKPVKFEKKDK